MISRIRNSENLRARGYKATSLLTSDSSASAFLSILEISKKAYFVEHLRTAGSIISCVLFWILRRSIFGSVNLSHMADQSGESSFLQNIPVARFKGCYLHFHKTYDQQFWTEGTSKKVDPLKQLPMTSSCFDRVFWKIVTVIF